MGKGDKEVTKPTHRTVREVKRWLRPMYLSILVIVTVYAVMGVYILAILVPFNVPILNPPEPPTDKEFGLVYPNFTDCIGQCSSAGQVFVDVVLRSVTSPIFDNQKVSVTALASGYPPLNSSKSIKVVLEGALPYVYQLPNSIVISPPAFGGVTLTPTPNCPGPRVGYGPPYFCGDTQSIYWSLPGSYFPSLSITLGNGTVVTEHLTDYRITVYPADVFNTRQYNKVTVALTVALTIFGFVEGLKTILDIRDRRSHARLRNPPHSSVNVI